MKRGATSCSAACFRFLEALGGAQFSQDYDEDNLEARDAETGMLPLQYSSPESEHDMDKDEDDEDEDEEDEVKRPAPSSRVPQMVPRQVGTNEQRPCRVKSHA